MRKSISRSTEKFPDRLRISAYRRFDRGPTARMRGTTAPDGYTYQYNDAATKDVWRRTVAWFRANLGN